MFKPDEADQASKELAGSDSFTPTMEPEKMTLKLLVSFVCSLVMLVASACGKRGESPGLEEGLAGESKIALSRPIQTELPTRKIVLSKLGDRNYRDSEPLYLREFSYLGKLESRAPPDYKSARIELADDMNEWIPLFVMDSQYGSSAGFRPIKIIGGLRPEKARAIVIDQNGLCYSATSPNIEPWGPFILLRFMKNAKTIGRLDKEADKPDVRVYEGTTTSPVNSMITSDGELLIAGVAPGKMLKITMYFGDNSGHSIFLNLYPDLVGSSRGSIVYEVYLNLFLTP